MPGEWTKTSLGSVADVIVGGTPSTAIPAFWGGTIPWMASGDVHAKRVFDVPGRITEKGYAASNAKLVHPPTVALGLAGQGKTRGTAALINVELSTNQSIALIKPQPELADATYLYHNLDFRYDELRSSSAGGGRAGLSKGILEVLPLHLPPLPEQRRIAEILDTLDRTIESTQRIIEKLQATRQGLLHDLLTRGLDEHGQLRDPARNPEQFKETELGRLPREWAVSSFSEVLAAVIDCPHTTPVFTTTGVPIARTSSIRNGHFDVRGASRTSYSDYLHRISRGRPETGDIVFTREAPVGEAFVIPKGLEVSLGQRTVLLKPSKLLSPEYLLQYIYSSSFGLHIKNLTGGTTNPHLNVSEIRRIPLPLPGIQEQNRIVALLQAHQARTATEQSRLAKLQALKRGLMDDLLTGRVRVPTVPDSA